MQIKDFHKCPILKVNGSARITLNQGWFNLNDLLKEVAESSCVVIPVNEKKISYCVGLSSVVEAMCLGKPIIATYNPYWHIDIEKEGIGIIIRNNTKEEWVNAINSLVSNKEMLVSMGQKARALAREKYNFAAVSREIRRSISPD